MVESLNLNGEARLKTIPKRLCYPLESLFCHKSPNRETIEEPTFNIDDILSSIYEITWYEKMIYIVDSLSSKAMGRQTTILRADLGYERNEEKDPPVEPDRAFIVGLEKKYGITFHWKFDEDGDIEFEPKTVWGEVEDHIKALFEVMKHYNYTVSGTLSYFDDQTGGAYHGFVYVAKDYTAMINQFNADVSLDHLRDLNRRKPLTCKIVRLEEMVSDDDAEKELKKLIGDQWSIDITNEGNVFRSFFTKEQMIEFGLRVKGDVSIDIRKKKADKLEFVYTADEEEPRSAMITKSRTKREGTRSLSYWNNCSM